MNTQIATFLFLLASAMGATIIVAKGDIFHAFRAWILSKSKKNKVWVHDVTLPVNSVIVQVKINGVFESCNIKASDLTETDLAIELKNHGDLLSLKVDRLPDFSTRIYLESLNKKAIVFTILNGYPESNFPCGIYEKSDTIKWISFIHDMISCPQCCGVWVGMIWFILYTIGALAFFVFQMLCMGCIVSLFASLYWKLHDLLNSYTNKK